MTTIAVTWEKFDQLIEELANKIRNSPLKPRFIYGISRGGLVPAVALSHRLNGIPITFNPKESFVLFVDDISREGKSLTYYSTLSPCFATATLFAEEGAKVLPDFWTETISKKAWIKMPWEIKAYKKPSKVMTLKGEV